MVLKISHMSLKNNIIIILDIVSGNPSSPQVTFATQMPRHSRPSSPVLLLLTLQTLPSMYVLSVLRLGYFTEPSDSAASN